jgi:DNA-binding transcriptional ArsR family regulator
MTARKSGDDPPEAREQTEIYTLTDLEQVKVLSDPLRLRILEVLCARERTTKQVAEEIGEKPTRLYHHVDALERVGLIRLSRTRQNRGTVEKYYLGVARAFRADTSLFSTTGDTEATKTVADVVGSMMETTAQDLRRLINFGHDITSGDESLLSYTEIRMGEESIAKIRTRLWDFLKELEAEDCPTEPDENLRRYRLTLAYYPLDLDDASGKD